ncbi:hypothetical protein D3C73_1347720 [compost metagenome]
MIKGKVDSDPSANVPIHLKDWRRLLLFGPFPSPVLEAHLFFQQFAADMQQALSQEPHVVEPIAANSP